VSQVIFCSFMCLQKEGCFCGDEEGKKKKEEGKAELS
jgi:hypothetical protein